ncbi:hypothetical protein [Nostoc sp. LEGE 12450]|uniref:hypothetical protein n=1 Tax=Nostoc sp. LEGE 12450 TaxID=1828643 RepID=UPI001882F558|nr:hypothetical protein [Nostoc sp. LEGE 12450]MBE8991398.1 hypothetical protein [Nostoc sp. LEGE 12450]
MPHTPQWIYTVCLTFSTIVMIFLFRHDWNRLAKLYRTKEAPPQNFSRMQSGSVGLVHYKGTLNVGITPQGIYLSIFPLFTLGLPPLLIPWSAIRKIEPANQLFIERFRLFLSSPKVKLILSKDILEPAKEFLATQGFEWI